MSQYLWYTALTPHKDITSNFHQPPRHQPSGLFKSDNSRNFITWKTLLITTYKHFIKYFSCSNNVYLTWKKQDNWQLYKDIIVFIASNLKFENRSRLNKLQFYWYKEVNYIHIFLKASILILVLGLCINFRCTNFCFRKFFIVNTFFC